MNLFLHLVAVVSLQYGSIVVNGQNYVLTSSCGVVVTEGSSCVLTCDTGDASETPIAWTVGSSTYEVGRATCTTSIPPVPSDYVLTCPGTNFTLNITAASVTRDKTNWRCSYSLGGKPSNLINLDVQGTTTTPPTTTAVPDPDPDPNHCDCARITVIILVVLLVVKIATDVFFVAYRWGDKCKQIIDTDRQRNILYRICFVQGIINSICGVVFIIIICLAYLKCLEEAVAIAALVISIIVLITGLIYIVMFLCKVSIEKKRNILNWICFVQGIINSICGVVFIIVICAAYPECLGKGLPIAVIVIGVIVVITGVINIAIVFVRPGDKRTPAPSSLPPIRPSMASPRKPVPPSSTTPRTLPSPTSDPASDSAVNPTVYLEPLSVEEPKKKKKKRKKRKTTTEAGEESSDQPKNPTGDNDE